jgi:hypothetical protein
MVKVKFIRGAADHAPSTIPLPHCELDVRRNDTSTSGVEPDRHTEILVALHGNKLESEDGSAATLLAPGIDEMKDSVVGPDALPKLLVHSDALGRSLTSLGLLGGLMKQAVGCRNAVLLRRSRPRG